MYRGVSALGLIVKRAKSVRKSRRKQKKKRNLLFQPSAIVSLPGGPGGGVHHSIAVSKGDVRLHGGDLKDLTAVVLVILAVEEFSEVPLVQGLVHLALGSQDALKCGNHSVDFLVFEVLLDVLQQGVAEPDWLRRVRGKVKDERLSRILPQDVIIVLHLL